MIVAGDGAGPHDGQKSGGRVCRICETGKKSGWLSFGGWINAIIPLLIVPYYSVIGGWVIKYLMEYVKGQSSTLASDGYFSSFISNGVSAELCALWCFRC